jgi:SAM-dependent methyltransferase
VAADYDQAGFLHQISRGLVTRAGVGNGAPVLELGCGTGAAQAEAARRVDPDGPVVGIDLAEPMAAEAAALEPDPLESVVRFGRRTVQRHGASTSSTLTRTASAAVADPVWNGVRSPGRLRDDLDRRAPRSFDLPNVDLRS